LSCFYFAFPLIIAIYFLGFYSNHSLRATCATRLFESGIDEQLIAKQTGHRSLAIRSYKRPCEEQEKTVSAIIQEGSKKICTETVSCPSATASASVAASPPSQSPAATNTGDITIPTSSGTVNSNLTFTFNIRFK
jgi:hypothetical protein